MLRLGWFARGLRSVIWSQFSRSRLVSAVHEVSGLRFVIPLQSLRSSFVSAVQEASGLRSVIFAYHAR